MLYYIIGTVVLLFVCCVLFWHYGVKYDIGVLQMVGFICGVFGLAVAWHS
jgi:hypothetical protein